MKKYTDHIVALQKISKLSFKQKRRVIAYLHSRGKNMLDVHNWYNSVADTKGANLANRQLLNTINNYFNQ